MDNICVLSALVSTVLLILISSRQFADANEIIDLNDHVDRVSGVVSRIKDDVAADVGLQRQRGFRFNDWYRQESISEMRCHRNEPCGIQTKNAGAGNVHVWGFMGLDVFASWHPNVDGALFEMRLIFLVLFTCELVCVLREGLLRHHVIN
ncbi:uncharacterized protein LOC144363584 [Saccoglossus kowalevskii]